MALAGIITTEILIERFINQTPAQIDKSRDQWLIIDQRKNSKELTI